MISWTQLALFPQLSVAVHVRVISCEQELASISRQASDMRPQRLRYKRDTLKLEHARRWAGVQVDWLAHFRTIAELAPDRSTVVLDDWNGFTYYKVPVMGQMTDPNIAQACADCGLQTPCAGPNGCQYNDNVLEWYR